MNKRHQNNGFTSHYEDEIGTETYNQLWDCCNALCDEADFRFIGLSRVKVALKSPYLATLREIHARLQACKSTARSVPNFLIERYRCHHGPWILVVLAALNEPIPEPYLGDGMDALGFAYKLPSAIKTVRVQ
jgi:hypothetical protein